MIVPILKIALRALARNKARSALTMLGIIIGVASVIAMVSLGQGAQKQVQDQISSMGANLLIVQAGSQRTGGMRGGAGTSTTLTVEDMEAILRDVPDVAAATPSVSAAAPLVVGNQNWTTRAEGVNTSYPAIRLRDVAKKYGSWTAAANGAGLEVHEDVSNPPLEWNDAYFKLVADCLPGLAIEVVDSLALTPIASMIAIACSNPRWVAWICASTISIGLLPSLLLLQPCGAPRQGLQG